MGVAVHFETDFDRGGWPGPSGFTNNAIGELWLGPAGFLGRLETELGLGGPNVSAPVRAARLIPRLEATEGYWSASFKHDRLGTARRLLADRDELVACGWSGAEAAHAVSQRLAQLAGVTSGADPGPVDRLRNVMRALGKRRTQLERVILHVDPTTLPHLWRRALDALESQGVAVTTDGERTSQAEGDLRAVLDNDFSPAGDGSLQLVRPYGPLEAAEDVAAMLAALESLDGVVLIGPDPILDAALTRHGLPCTGQPRVAGALGSIVPLAVEAGWAPQDPAIAYQLLTVAGGPVPRNVAWHLRRALAKWPSLEHPDFAGRLAQGLAQIEDEERRTRVEERVIELLKPLAERDTDHYPVADLEFRLELLGEWALARSHARAVANEDPALAASLAQVAQHASNLREILNASEQSTLGSGTLRRWVAASAPRGVTTDPGAQAGVRWVRHPGQLVGNVQTAVWWNFTQRMAPRVVQHRATPAERAALAELGVELPDLGRAALAHATRWRRPLLAATERLIAISPRRNERGEESFPHPLWDEVLGRLRPGAGYAPLLRPKPQGPAAPETASVPLLPVPVPARAWTTTAGHRLVRDTRSPSSAEYMVRCSLQWALRYFGAKTTSVPLGVGSLLAGRLAHHVLEQLAREELFTNPDETANRAEALFDAAVRSHAAPYAQPGADVHRATLRHQVAQGARAIAELLATSAATVNGVEHEVTADIGDATFQGYLDLVLRDPDLVVDYKLGSSGRWDELRNGTAFQLAIYGALLRSQGYDPALAYLILKQGHVLANRDVPGALHIAGPTPSAQWEAALAAWNAVRQEVARGQLTATGVEADPSMKQDALIGGQMRLLPKCLYCAFGAVCGVTSVEQHG